MRLSIATVFLLSTLGPAAGADPAVVELFTSQGCSSCPPADEMLGELAAREDVIALSLHVDYWDWIGWPDSFASPEMTSRQRGYALAHGVSTLFTPQFVVDGDRSVAGADGQALSAVLGRRGEGDRVLRIGPGPEGPSVHARETGRPVSLVLVTFLPEAEVTVTSGENAGMTATYHNVVEEVRPLASLDGEEAVVPIPAGPPGRSRAVLAQVVDVRGRPGAILGAVRVD